MKRILAGIVVSMFAFVVFTAFATGTATKAHATGSVAITVYSRVLQTSPPYTVAYNGGLGITVSGNAFVSSTSQKVYIQDCAPAGPNGNCQGNWYTPSGSIKTCTGGGIGPGTISSRPCPGQGWYYWSAIYHYWYRTVDEATVVGVTDGIPFTRVVTAVSTAIRIN